MKFWHFFKEAWSEFSHTGTLFPSSEVAAIRMVGYLSPPLKYVVEFGGGMGAVTQEILKAMPPTGRLVSLEIVPRYAASLREIDDSRLEVKEMEVQKYMEESRFENQIDGVVSGIPFTFLKPPARLELVGQIYRALRPGGKIVLYQNSPLMFGTIKEVFGHCKMDIEWRNLPPYFFLSAAK